MMMSHNLSMHGSADPEVHMGCAHPATFLTRWTCCDKGPEHSCFGTDWIATCAHAHQHFQTQTNGLGIFEALQRQLQHQRTPANTRSKHATPLQM